MLVKSSTYIKVKDLALPQKTKHYKVNKKDSFVREGEEVGKMIKKAGQELWQDSGKGNILFLPRIDDRNVISTCVRHFYCVLKLSTWGFYET